ncbi:hypothetical protein P886_4772 [Alteromonadaceae bacterium 2753L.S.0a.02]|nr:hypothetical protein P886_4772 [Alteromonadaceae bacterium 2753L.S.0a.02]
MLTNSASRTSVPALLFAVAATLPQKQSPPLRPLLQGVMFSETCSHFYTLSAHFFDSIHILRSLVNINEVDITNFVCAIGNLYIPVCVI